VVKQMTVKATVCIPVFNGGRLLQTVVERVLEQRIPSGWRFETIVVDSSSTDGGCDFLLNDDRVIYWKIPQSDFGHGRTRNFCAELGTGEFILVLTQDALPTDEFWLYNMVTAMEQYPEAGGAFGRHIAWPDSSVFTRRDLEDHFAGFSKYPLLMSRDTDQQRWDAKDVGWRQILHFFSDNNSCLRRSVWEQIPYPDIEFGEDQVWANMIIEAGFGRLYVPSATVYHSHDYTPEEAEKRAATEARFFAREFGYRQYEDDQPFETKLRQINDGDRVWARLNGISSDELARRLVENEAKLRGLAAGSK
jgi:glycosyltransferase involved in cell wall biosynthesis